MSSRYVGRGPISRLDHGRYQTSFGRGIERVRFRKIPYSGAGMPDPSLITGYEARRVVRDVVIENLVIGGRRAKVAAGAHIEIGSHVTRMPIR